LLGNSTSKQCDTFTLYVRGKRSKHFNAHKMEDEDEEEEGGGGGGVGGEGGGGGGEGVEGGGEGGG
jgi:hypothetical protein